MPFPDALERRSATTWGRWCGSATTTTPPSTPTSGPASSTAPSTCNWTRPSFSMHRSIAALRPHKAPGCSHSGQQASLASAAGASKQRTRCVAPCACPPCACPPWRVCALIGRRAARRGGAEATPGRAGADDDGAAATLSVIFCDVRGGVVGFAFAFSFQRWRCTGPHLSCRVPCRLAACVRSSRLPIGDPHKGRAPDELRPNRRAARPFGAPSATGLTLAGFERFEPAPR